MSQKPSQAHITLGTYHNAQPWEFLYLLPGVHTFLLLDTFLSPLTPQDVSKCSCTVSVPTTPLPPYNAKMETKRAWTPEGARGRVPEPQFPLLRKEDPHWGWCAKKYHMAHS